MLRYDKKYFPLFKTNEMNPSYSFQHIFLSKKLMPYYFAFLIISACTFINFILIHFVNISNLLMIYLLGIVMVAIKQNKNRGPAILAVIVSIASFDFFFTSPRFSLSVYNGSDVITLVIMFIIAQIISHFITLAQKQTDATRKAYQKIEKERFRNILLTSISHDLRTPLTTIMGSASSLLESKELSVLPERELIKNIYDDSERLNSLVTNILQIIRLESGEVHITKQLHVLEELIGAALNQVEKRVDKKNIITHLPQIIPLVPSDPILIQQVLINLLDNAIKFSSDNTPIEIFVEVYSRKILLKVSDHGPGLHSEEINKIFNRFYQSHQPKTNGMGLGLAICKSIIEAHGGQIWAENNIHGGALFCFTLPLKTI